GSGAQGPRLGYGLLLFGLQHQGQQYSQHRKGNGSGYQRPPNRQPLFQPPRLPRAFDREDRELLARVRQHGGRHRLGMRAYGFTGLGRGGAWLLLRTLPGKGEGTGSVYAPGSDGVSGDGRSVSRGGAGPASLRWLLGLVLEGPAEIPGSAGLGEDLDRRLLC